jgi:hypothetical protein
MRVVVVDGHPATRRGLREILNDALDTRLVEETHPLAGDGGAERRASGVARGKRGNGGVEYGELTGCIASHEREEVDQVTVMVAHPPREEVTEALVWDSRVGDAISGMSGSMVPDLYEPPVAELDHIEHESESYWWVLVLVFAAALAWAAYCRQTGGRPVIRATWRGFIVRCY